MDLFNSLVKLLINLFYGYVLLIIIIKYYHNGSVYFFPFCYAYSDSDKINLVMYPDLLLFFVTSDSIIFI